MKIVLTGAQGNLGSHIFKLNAFDILAIDKSNWNSLQSIDSGDCQAVIHCASDLKNDLNKDPDLVLDSNILSTAKLLKICKEKKINKFVFISSCSVYGESSNSCEDRICEPITMNGHTKVFNEQLVKSFCVANNINYLIIRVFNSFGGKDQFSVVQKMISCAKNKGSFTLLNEGIAERDFIHIEDVAAITVQLTQMDIRNQIINVGSGKSVRIIDLLTAIEKKFGSIQVFKRNNENETVFSRANIKKLNDLIKWEYRDIFQFINSF